MKKIIIQNEEVDWNKNSLIQGIQMAHSMKQPNNKINMIEFGVYTGDSIRLSTEYFNYLKRPNFILGIDSFEGLPEETINIDRFEHYKPGGFGDVLTKDRSYANAKLLKRWFLDLKKEDIEEYKIDKFDIVHIDCDLHISTIQAYEFLLNNNLIQPNTIVVYDEFKSTKKLYGGGESLAHKEITEKYKIEFKEFFRNQYYDKLNDLEFWQNAFLIQNIGLKSDIGLITIEENK